ncbi:preprotein translocase SecYEG, SecG subunit [Campylobacter blaseri]|uniref:Protein-export membrane protein SecG n=1 Tax=Campylobacter blaseri TaxID=2042961 RepID=A0A2P8R3P4_9BACT|nr:preprotein translocase subunit SecG [Campylobacter blaseri]PSM53089.1 preprotein translocase subunit SecG [Campylobacter blaseri]PSM54556.1 preprotein translocase subunit SecG [Campylobacter blaseri]QKF86973.1 preprotein translocase SecYEG, SecG subunit [Campylobacter blaseri]
MTTIFLTLQFVLTVILVIAVLLQKSSSIGLGAYSGSNESLFGAKGASGFLAKFTAVIGIVFILNTLALGYSYQKSSSKSVLDSVDTKNIEIPASNIPSIPSVPNTK